MIDEIASLSFCECLSIRRERYSPTSAFVRSHRSPRWGRVRMIEVAFLLFSSAVAVTFFVSSLVLMNLGRRLGARYLAREGTPTVSGLDTVETAVFALMGLVLAFAISGALQRFDERKQLILQEVNAIGTAYDRLGLLENPARLELKSALKAYLRGRIDLYQRGISFSFRQGAEVASEDRLARLSELKTTIWDGAVKACAPADKKADCILILPSLNSTFDAGQLRDGANERHPPHVLFVMLFGIGLGASLLAGFGMAATKARSWAHMMIFAGGVAVALFVVTDLEYPRLGLVRVDSFDHFAKALYDQMR